MKKMSVNLPEIVIDRFFNLNVKKSIHILILQKLPLWSSIENGMIFHVFPTFLKSVFQHSWLSFSLRSNVGTCPVTPCPCPWCHCDVIKRLELCIWIGHIRSSLVNITISFICYGMLAMISASASLGWIYVWYTFCTWQRDLNINRNSRLSV